MADKNLLAQMLENLVNEDQAKAEELFHEYVVAKSREIYEGLIESELDETAEEDEEEVDEAAEDEEAEDEKMDENFEDIAYEGDDEGNPFAGGDEGGDATDDLAGELDGEEGEEGERSEEELFMDLDSIVDELQAKFDELKGEESGEGEFDGEEEMPEEGMELATVREYVEKVPAGHGAEKKGSAEQADGSATGLKFSKNDMGGTTANILSGRNGVQAGEANQGQLKGSALNKQKPQVDDAGNINVPGAKNGNAFNKKEPGHGAEKAGSKEQADKGAQSLFRGRR